MPPASNRKSKTSRFPVARIKKIMQMDEEVGKLASATPVMISKSLECFMQLLIDETCKETRQRGSRKMTAYHLKHTISTQPTLDFLLPIVSSISDPAPADEVKAKPQRKATDPTRKRKKKEEEVGGSSANPTTLPMIGTWKRDMEGTGGTGDGGRGMFDDYEEDEDDY